MKDVIIDATNLPCPRPLIMTKKGLSEKKPDERLVILINNETSKENVERFLIDNGVDVKIAQTDELYTVYATGSLQQNARTQSASACICLTSNVMGRGDDDLGRVLIQGFVNTLGDVKPLPATLIFYNSGIKLTLDDSPVLPALKALESRGVDIIVCGTCADFYSVKDRVSAGRISNMYEIIEKLSAASKVIYP